MRLPFTAAPSTAVIRTDPSVRITSARPRPTPREIADQPKLAKFGVGGPWSRNMTTGELAAVIHCYPTQMEVIQRAPAEAAG